VKRSGTRLAIGAVVAAAVMTFGVAEAPAPVPPKDCGNIKVSGKRYNIKSDQLRCRRARRYSRRYLSGDGRPRGYRCRNYGRSTAIKFRCENGAKVFFAIRR
jgi:hypothetical protein